MLDPLKLANAIHRRMPASLRASVEIEERDGQKLGRETVIRIQAFFDDQPLSHESVLDRFFYEMIDDGSPSTLELEAEKVARTILFLMEERVRSSAGAADEPMA